MTAHRYFVAFMIQREDGSLSFQNSTLTASRPVTSHDDMNSMHDKLKEDHPEAESLVILSWQKYDATPRSLFERIFGA